MIVAPPFEFGAVKAIVSVALPTVAVTAVGAPGALAVAGGVGVEGVAGAVLLLPPPPPQLLNAAAKHAKISKRRMEFFMIE